MKIAVIGGGLFGSTAAVHLRRAGHAVTLFEKEKDIFQAASGINQYRLHRGYHYPRSQETIASSKRSENSFRQEYGEAVLSHIEHYYAIAKEGSKVSASEYLDVLAENGLEYAENTPSLLCEENIALCVRTKEALIDPVLLKKICRQRLDDAGVVVRFGVKADMQTVKDFDMVVNCAYASLNDVRKGGEEKEYQFEIVEKLVVKLPDDYKNKSVVIMDGPFLCIDPFGLTGYHVVGHVLHAIHAANTGKFPVVPGHLADVLNKGVIEAPQHSHFPDFILSGKMFFKDFEKAHHIGSMYTVRTVLPNLDATDARPTLVEKVSENMIQVFSGKLSNCVEASIKVVALLK